MQAIPKLTNRDIVSESSIPLDNAFTTLLSMIVHDTE
jgi:hypothetical protein